MAVGRAGAGHRAPRPDDWPTAATEAAGVIGDPVRHSLSPLLHNSAFAALGIDWAFLAFPVARGDAAAAVAGARSLGLAGLAVTMPHKAEVARHLDRLSAAAERLGAVNVVTRRGGELEGHSTDGEGFLDSLREAGFDPAGARALVLGAGGAARAVVAALAEAGAGQVSVVARRPEQAAAAATLAGGAGRVGAVEEAREAGLVVNATPLGMAGGPARAALEPALLGPGQLVVDLVYHPAVTPLLRSARERGASTLGGVGMLVHQAARAFSLWTGADPPVEVMRDAARRAIGDAGGGAPPTG